GAGQQIGQAVIALWTHNEIDRRHAANDLVTFGLGDAAGDRDGDAPAGSRCGVLHAADAAELGINFLRRLFANVAGVEDDQIGVVGACGLDIAFRRQSVRHTLRVVDVHLAAERLDVEFFRSVHAGWSAYAPISAHKFRSVVTPSLWSSRIPGKKELAGFGSVHRLDIGVLDHFRPLGDFRLDIGIEFLGATAAIGHAEVGE